MSCQNVETIMTELARGQMLEAGVREEALAHVEACERCSQRLADEQTLTSGLRAVAASVASTNIPARIETELLVAFRQGATTPFVSASGAAAKSKPTHLLPWSMAAAAAILILSALAIPRLLSSNSREPAGQQASDAQPLGELSPEKENPEIQPIGAPVGVDGNPPGVQSRPSPITERRALIRTAGFGKRSVRRLNDAGGQTNSSEEVATDFMPLTYGGNLSQLDDGQVVRVELPRSALQSFGLPVNADRGNERVKADVLLGHDGVARAIRFIR